MVILNWVIGGDFGIPRKEEELSAPWLEGQVPRLNERVEYDHGKSLAVSRILWRRGGDVVLYLGYDRD